MKKIKKLILVMFLVLSSIFVIKANASVIEDPDSFIGGEDVYIIGSTKFDNGYAITGQRAFEAGMNEIILYQNMNLDINDIDKTTYYYNKWTKKWYAKNEEGVPKNLNKQQQEKFDKGLQIIFVNNKVKKVELEYTGDVLTESLEEGITYSNNKFSIPANISGFYFETENGMVEVSVSKDEEYIGTPGSFYIPNTVLVYLGENQVNSFQTNSDNKLYEEIVYGPSYGENYDLVADYFEDEDGNKIDFATKTFKDGEKIYAITSKLVAYYCTPDGEYGYSYTSPIGINSLEEAIENSSENMKVCLAESLTLDKPIAIDANNKEMYFDLAGNTITSNGAVAIKLSGKNSILNINHGTINSEGNAALQVYIPDNTDNATAKLVVGNSLTINALQNGITVFGKGAILDFSGFIYLRGNDTYAISGNGLAQYAGTTINIKNGYISPNENVTGTFAIYAPQMGDINIEEAQLYADTVLGVKSGKVNIKDSYLYANGAKATEYKVNNDGINSTGDAIYIEMNKNYAKPVELNVENTVLSSANANPILVYNPDNLTSYSIITSDYKTVIKDIEAKTEAYISTEMAAFEANGKYYLEEDFEDILKNSEGDISVKLFSDIEINKLILLDKNIEREINIDLGGHTIYRDNQAFIFYITGKGTKITLENGTLRALDSKSGQVITLGEASAEEQNIHAIIKDDVIIETGFYGIVPVGKGVTLDFYGTIDLANIGAIGISGIGNENQGGTIINVYNGSKIYSKENHSGTVAIYLPQLGETNILGGDLSAHTVIGIKSGTLNITGGKLIAQGEKLAPVPTNNGINATGDTIYVERNGAYDNNIHINITGATLTSDNGKQILVYNPNKLSEPVINAEGYTIEYINE